MNAVPVDTTRITGAWHGRVAGCLLGKPVEVLSFQQGPAALRAYLGQAGALPLRDYVPCIEDTAVARLGRASCRGHIERAEADDDTTYTVLALMLLEDKGLDFDTADVARAWLKLLPAGQTWTAERAAYAVLLDNMADEFVNGEEPGFDLSLCSENACNEWIGAQIRADLYGWVCPGRPALAADLARRDAALSHRGEGINGAAFIAALGAAIPAAGDLDTALDAALAEIPADSQAAAAVHFGRELAGSADAVEQMHDHYAGMSPVHTLNNLALVVWAVCSANGDFSAGIGDAVAAGWDTDCNGATVGGLLGLSGAAIADHWTQPWNGRVGTNLAGVGELSIDELVERTVTVAHELQGDSNAIH